MIARRCRVPRNPEGKGMVYADLAYPSAYPSILPRLVRRMPFDRGVVARHARRRFPGDSIGKRGLASGPPREALRVVAFPRRKRLSSPHGMLCGARIVHCFRTVVFKGAFQGGEAAEGPTQPGTEAHLGCAVVWLA